MAERLQQQQVVVEVVVEEAAEEELLQEWQRSQRAREGEEEVEVVAEHWAGAVILE